MGGASTTLTIDATSVVATLAAPRLRIPRTQRCWGMHVPSYGLPDDQTLVTYLEVIYRVVIEARAAARSGDAKRAAALTDAVHNLPELLTRWPEVDEDMIWKLLDGIVERDQFGSWADCVPP